MTAARNVILKAAFDVVQECGWIPDGTTRPETVRIPTTSNPVFGEIGGEVVEFGSRQRFRKGDWFATIGPRTTNFYRRGPDGPVDMVQAKTSKLEDVRRLASEKGGFNSEGGCDARL